MKKLYPYFVIIDTGIILYWLIVIFKLIPQRYLFKDYYYNSVLTAWNWSFFPLEMLIAFTGLLSLYFWHKENPRCYIWALISLILTFCSGLQSIVFWTICRDFDLAWWLPKLFLLVYPLFFIPRMTKFRKERY